MVARKHGVPLTALLQTNGIANPVAVKPGQRLVIPRYVSSSAQQAAAPQAIRAADSGGRPVAAPCRRFRPSSGGDNVHIVSPGESLMGIARKNSIALSSLARANKCRARSRARLIISATADHHYGRRPQHQQRAGYSAHRRRRSPRRCRPR